MLLENQIRRVCLEIIACRNDIQAPLLLRDLQNILRQRMEQLRGEGPALPVCNMEPRENSHNSHVRDALQPTPILAKFP